MQFAVRQLDGLVHCRSAISAHLHEAGVAADLTEDVQLAASELATNGLVHAEASEIAVVAHVEPSTVTLEVTYPDTGVISRRPTGMAPTDSIGGRGIAIVEILAARVTTEVTENWLTRTTAVFDRS